MPFFFARNGVGLLLLTLLSLALVYYSVRGDREWLARKASAPRGSGTGSWKTGWRTQKILSPIIGIAYAFVLSLLAFDLIMSLDPHWYSTLFGAYYFMGSFYVGIAALYLVSLIFLDSPGLRDYIQRPSTSRSGEIDPCLFGVYRLPLLRSVQHHLVRKPSRGDALRDPAGQTEPLGTAGLGILLILIIPFFVLLRRRIK